MGRTKKLPWWFHQSSIRSIVFLLKWVIMSISMLSVGVFGLLCIAPRSFLPNLCFISLNAQSINAKFDSLLTFLEDTRQQNVILHVICTQETWLDEKSDLSVYKSKGYTCISQGKRCSSHGGLITYVDSQFNTSIMDIKNDSSITERLFVAVKDIETGKEIVVGNIYRPPYDDNNEQNVTTFLTELEPIISTLNDNNHELLIAGDVDINLPHINICNKEHIGQSLDMLLGYSLFPKITFRPDWEKTVVRSLTIYSVVYLTTV